MHFVYAYYICLLYIRKNQSRMEMGKADAVSKFEWRRKMPVSEWEKKIKYKIGIIPFFKAIFLRI